MVQRGSRFWYRGDPGFGTEGIQGLVQRGSRFWYRGDLGFGTEGRFWYRGDLGFGTEVIQSLVQRGLKVLRLAHVLYSLFTACLQHVI